MRCIFRNPSSEMNPVLLVESGPRELSLRFLPILRKVCGKSVGVDVFSCLPPPEGNTALGIRDFYRSQDFQKRTERTDLIRKLRANRYQVIVLLCANSPLLSRWKWVLALRLPAKVLIANENADCFWLDAAHWRPAKSMLAERFGLRGSGFLKLFAQLLLFPWVLLYLIAFALVVNALSRLRPLFGWRPSSRLS
ncbi:MAG: hypothetical protein LC114_24340 [Bryobacterales bacterium]|nr:hypothetical protein [Bryobacterales bacterium]